MKDSEAADLLHDLARRVTVRPAPLGEVQRRGARARNRRRTVSLLVAAAVVAILATTGTAVTRLVFQHGSGDSASRTVASTQGGVLGKSGHYVLVAARYYSEGGVGYAGTVELVGECLGIDGAVVLWPNGSKIISSTPLAVDVPGVGRVEVGTTVQGGGAQYTNDPPFAGVDVPAGCRGPRVITFTPNR